MAALEARQEPGRRGTPYARSRMSSEAQTAGADAMGRHTGDGAPEVAAE